MRFCSVRFRAEREAGRFRASVRGRFRAYYMKKKNNMKKKLPCSYHSTDALILPRTDALNLHYKTSTPAHDLLCWNRDLRDHVMVALDGDLDSPLDHTATD